MYCSACGKENENISKFCSSCGQEFNIEKPKVLSYIGKTFFSFSGNMKRKEFVLNFLLIIIIALSSAVLASQYESLSGLFTIIFLTMFWSMTAITAKRVRDVGTSVWVGTIFALFFLPYSIYVFFAKSKNS